MEHQPRPTPSPIEYESIDDYQIDRGMAEAEQDERVIDDATARRIAAQLHGGQASALYSLAFSGAVDYEALSAEMRQETSALIDHRTRSMYAHLGLYSEAKGSRGPVEGWYKLAEDVNVSSPEEEPTDPRVWIGCLAARNTAVYHGRWVNALQDAQELEQDAERMLEASPVEAAEEYYIGDSENFHGLGIHEYDSLTDVAVLARLVHTHAEPFVRWAGHTGYRDTNELERQFQEAYHGTFASRDAYVEHVLQQSDAYGFKQFVPEDLRDHVHYDLEAIADLWESDRTLFIESNDGSAVYVYDAHA